MAAYKPAPLSKVADARCVQLVEAAKKGRLVLYLGAGVSVADPACGPTGRDVAEFVRPVVARILDVNEDELDGASLEAMAQRVSDEAGERLDELRARAAKTIDFQGIEPNFGHIAAALLLREGLVQVVSANWDCGVEAAGRQVDVTIAGLVDAGGSVQATAGPHLSKVHGCATRPATIALTQGDIDKPQTWAVSRTQAALTSGTVVFVGLGTPGAYVHEPIVELKKTWISQAANVYVVDPQMSALWCNALGPENASKVHMASGADEFLDELLRAIVRDALDDAESRIGQLAREEQWAATMSSGLAELRKSVGAATADSVLRWWRDGVVSSTAGRQFVTDVPGQACLMTVAYLAGRDGGEVEVARVGGQQTVASGEQYFEIVARPGEHINQVEKVARHRIECRRAEGVYSDVTRRVTVVVPQAMGRFPSEVAPLDIAAGDESGADIASGVESVELRFVSAEDGVQGRLAA
ncbi:MAG: SIR2 family protein [Solirubrobacteraceae bacterium]